MPIDLNHMPVGGTEAGRDVLADRPGGVAVIGDVVVVPKERQFAQLEVPRERDGLLPNPLLQTTVTNESPCAVIHQFRPELRRQPFLGHRHTHRAGNPLTEQAGGDFDPRMLLYFRVSGGHRPEFAEVLQRVGRELFVARQVQQRIEKHRPMTIRQHHPVAIRPEWIIRVGFQVVGVERRRNLGHS